MFLERPPARVARAVQEGPPLRSPQFHGAGRSMGPRFARSSGIVPQGFKLKVLLCGDSCKEEREFSQRCAAGVLLVRAQVLSEEALLRVPALYITDHAHHLH